MTRRFNPSLHPRDDRGRWAEKAAGRLPAPTTFKAPPGRLGDAGTYPAEQAIPRAVIHDGDGWWRVHSKTRQGRRVRLELIRNDGTTAEREYPADHPLQFGTGKDLFEQTRDWGKTATTGADAKEMGRLRRDATVKTFRRLTRREQDLKRNQLRLDSARRMVTEGQEYWRKRGQRAGYEGDRLDQFINENVPAAYHNRVVELEQHRENIKARTVSWDLFDSEDAELTVKPDPDRPLAMYGDMIKYGGGRAPLVQARALSRIPVEFHYQVAVFMAGKNTGGMHLVPRASGEVWQFSNQHGDEAPRGWHEGATWAEVDGVYDPNERAMVAGWSPTMNHARVEETTLHEFGHALDHAMGDQSKTEEWKGIYRGIVFGGGKKKGHFNPYFEQEGHAGPEEFWAEAFGTWTRATSSAAAGANEEELQNHMARRLSISDQAAQTLDYYFQGQQKWARKVYEGAA